MEAICSIKIDNDTLLGHVPLSNTPLREDINVRPLQNKALYGSQSIKVVWSVCPKAKRHWRAKSHENFSKIAICTQEYKSDRGTPKLKSIQKAILNHQTHQHKLNVPSHY